VLHAVIIIDFIQTDKPIYFAPLIPFPSISRATISPEHHELGMSPPAPEKFLKIYVQILPFSGNLVVKTLLYTLSPPCHAYSDAPVCTLVPTYSVCPSLYGKQAPVPHK